MTFGILYKKLQGPTTQESQFLCDFPSDTMCEIEFN